jgi:hypothetical protein
VRSHAPFDHCSLSIYAKGSYPNNTNVKTDSDVDVAVQCHDVFYWDEAVEGAKTSGSPYKGIWTPDKLRSELETALRAKFPGQIDTSGSTAIGVNSSSSRVDADVVPCFNYRYYFSSGGYREGIKIFRRTGLSTHNYPAQHLEQGRKKNNLTQTRFKKAVRILKRVENRMVDEGAHREVPSFFVESLAYNCPNTIIQRTTWTSVVKGVLSHIWNELDGPEPDENRWHEVNNCKFLFHDAQKWTPQSPGNSSPPPRCPPGCPEKWHAESGYELRP